MKYSWDEQQGECTEFSRVSSEAHLWCEIVAVVALLHQTVKFSSSLCPDIALNQLFAGFLQPALSLRPFQVTVPSEFGLVTGRHLSI